MKNGKNSLYSNATTCNPSKANQFHGQNLSLSLSLFFKPLKDGQ